MNTKIRSSEDGTRMDIKPSLLLPDFMAHIRLAVNLNDVSKLVKYGTATVLRHVELLGEVLCDTKVTLSSTTHTVGPDDQRDNCAIWWHFTVHCPVGSPVGECFGIATPR